MSAGFEWYQVMDNICPLDFLIENPLFGGIYERNDEEEVKRPPVGTFVARHDSLADVSERSFVAEIHVAEE